MPKGSSGLSKKTYLDYPHWPSVQKFVTGVSSLHPRLVLLFGSVAKGNFTQHSDADVLVIFDRAVDWLEVYQHSDGLVEPIVKSWEEVKAALQRGEPLVVEIIEDGVVLWDSGGLYQRLVALAEEAKRKWGLVRVKGGWRWGAS